MTRDIQYIEHSRDPFTSVRPGVEQQPTKTDGLFWLMQYMKLNLAEAIIASGETLESWSQR